MPYAGTPSYISDDDDLFDPALSSEPESPAPAAPPLKVGKWRFRPPSFSVAPSNLPDAPQAPDSYAPNAPQPGIGSLPIDSPAPPAWTPDNDAAESLNRLKDAYNNRPPLPHPKWWQLALGGAAGFGAGWSNAASRTRSPIDIGAMQQNILAPGYGQKMSEWQQNVLGPAQIAAEIAGAKQAAWWKSQQLQAQIEMMRQRGAAYANSAEQQKDIEATQAMADASKGWVTAGQRIPATVASHLMDIHARNQPVSVYSPRVAEILNVKPGTPLSKWQIEDAMNQIKAFDKPQIVGRGAAVRDPATDKVEFTNPYTFAPPKEVNPVAEELRQQRLEAARSKGFEQIDNTRKAQEQTISKDRQAEVAGLLKNTGLDTEDQAWTDPATSAKLKAINRRYAPKLQAIQDQYARSIRSRGGQAEDWTLDPNTLAYSQRALASTPAPAQAPTSATPQPQAPKSNGAAAPAQKTGSKMVTVPLPDGRFLTIPEENLNRMVQEQRLKRTGQS